MASYSNRRLSHVCSYSQLAAAVAKRNSPTVDIRKDGTCCYHHKSLRYRINSKAQFPLVAESAAL